MTIVVGTPQVDELPEVVTTLSQWQYEGAAMQIHPGDLGWYWRFGAATTANAIRTWTRDGQSLAIGLLDESNLLRMTTAPAARQDEQLAQHLLTDLNDPAQGVLGKGEVYVEAPKDALIHDVLAANGWHDDEPWTPLRRDLTEPVKNPDMRIEVTTPDTAELRAAMQRAAFTGSTFTAERWHTMSTAPAYTNAQCLIGYDDHDNPVAAVTVWSAGPGKPGLLEPMGVHHEHRGRGYATAINIAAAAALQQQGSSSALVCTPSSNVGAVAAYVSAGYDKRPEVRDKRRDA